MARKDKSLSEAEAKEVRLNPPYILNTFKTAALLEKSVRSVREMFNQDGFPLMRGTSPNSEMSVLRDDLVIWLKGNGSLVHDERS
jgi:hypothetical protein